MAALTLKTAPATEPVTTTEAKAHLRVTGTDDDTLIAALITAARQHVEDATGRALITQTWEYRLDAFPEDLIELPKPALVSVTSITYIDGDGASQTLTAVTDYDVDAKSEPARIMPSYGNAWPSTRDQMNAVTIEFIAGYGAASAVPQALKQAILLIIGHLYNNREDTMVGAPITAIPLGAKALMSPYRMVQI